jgi:MA3 domain
VIDTEQMQKGFQNIVENVDDIQLDVPDAVQLIAVFIERAIVDDILPPSFVQHIAGCQGLPQDCLYSCGIEWQVQHIVLSVSIGI